MTERKEYIKEHRPMEKEFVVGGVLLGCGGDLFVGWVCGWWCVWLG